MRARIFALFICALLGAGNNLSWAQTKAPLEKMRFIYSAVGGSQATVTLMR